MNRRGFFGRLARAAAAAAAAQYAPAVLKTPTVEKPKRPQIVQDAHDAVLEANFGAGDEELPDFYWRALPDSHWRSLHEGTTYRAVLETPLPEMTWQSTSD